jgi:hypothetical protein
MVEVNVSEKHTVCPDFSPEDGGNTLLRNVGFYQPVHTASKPIRISTLLSPPLKPQISN